jgi:hypothetical protein
MNEDDLGPLFQAFGKWAVVVLAAWVSIILALLWGILALLQQFGVLMLFVGLAA